MKKLLLLVIPVVLAFTLSAQISPAAGYSPKRISISVGSAGALLDVHTTVINGGYSDANVVLTMTGPVTLVDGGGLSCTGNVCTGPVPAHSNAYTVWSAPKVTSQFTASGFGMNVSAAYYAPLPTAVPVPTSTPQPSMDLAVTNLSQTVTSTVTVPMTRTFTLSNIGPVGTQFANVVDRFTNMVASASAPGFECIPTYFQYSSAQSGILCYRGTLNPGDSVTVTEVITPGLPGSWANHVDANVNVTGYTTAVRENNVSNNSADGLVVIQ